MDSLIEAALNAAALRSETCERHPDREGTLAIDLPSIGIKRFLCQECKADLTATLNAMQSNDPWVADRKYVQDRDAIYAYRDGVTREGKPTGQITWRSPR